MSFAVFEKDERGCWFMRSTARLLMIWLIVVLVAALPGFTLKGQASSLSQEDQARAKAKTMLAKMTPEERVGQLFLATFPGNTFDEKSQIYDLIASHHLGGV